MILASTARQLSTINSSIVEQESAIISVNIADAVGSNQVSTVVSNTTITVIGNAFVTGSIMTSDTTYYQVLQGAITDLVKQSEMTAIVNQFTSLGYTISQPSADGLSFYWNISW